MQNCRTCGRSFEMYPVVSGVRMNLRGRTRCLECRPHRALRSPRRKVGRRVGTQRCELCGSEFPTRALIDGRVQNLHRRKFCLTCSPFGTHNTSKRPSGIAAPDELREHRRRRRNARTYRCQKKRRQRRKAELVAALSRARPRLTGVFVSGFQSISKTRVVIFDPNERI